MVVGVPHDMVQHCCAIYRFCRRARHRLEEDDAEAQVRAVLGVTTGRCCAALHGAHAALLFCRRKNGAHAPLLCAVTKGSAIVRSTACNSDSPTQQVE
jgi:hypothetical protein